MASVLIIGAGWLGRPLAKQLCASQHNVYVTNSHSDTVQQSQQQGLNAYQLDFPIPTTASLCSLIEQLDIDTIIGCITPGFRRSAESDWDSYANNWQQICSAASQAGVKKVIMISSTAVYPSVSASLTSDHTKNTMQESNANLELSLNNDTFSQKSRALLQAEKKVIDCPVEHCIIRCSGLVDDIRHPSRFASRLRSVSRLAPANMLHKLDAIGIIEFALNEHWHGIVNASTPNTCDKAQFYQAAITASNEEIELPEIVDIPDKKIDSALSQQLGYQYQFQHTLDLL
ncbi:hypothetical protein A9264_06600 [Vibrio sp. UCD-FRSSP16_10]|uniref:NAD-dependent epimerase/dehydratase family protein n=1 Tax=unclassified Vibrio TaxID=2614977 RepID=UPI0007FBB811|nr:MULTISPECIES: NAD-dependent epimerase/dehydratase family protein [unclassified Vibrio]OBT15948.1 hypothetical protein A9264_06600 [Vibrio sp. UCD-FRSSP16_10]OBT17842.1 hypothetical protein A9260_00595 [Vibrio sp. UCD-FRSSP16_30]